MRRFLVIVAVCLGAVTAFGAGPASAKTAKPPVTLDGKVNNKGTKDVSTSKSAKFELEADDYYFEPTFIKVQPGEKVTITLKNEGSATHTFTSDALNVNQTVSPDHSQKITFTIPSNAKVFAFHCDFHVSMGMQGAFYTATSK